MITALLLAVTLQTPADLLFSEAWACSSLARMGREAHFGDTTPQTTDEQALWDGLTRLETLAREDAEQKATSRGFDAEKRTVEENDAQGMIDRASGDERNQMLDTCGAVFGILEADA